mgnify:CR=1 FL=1
MTRCEAFWGPSGSTLVRAASNNGHDANRPKGYVIAHIVVGVAGAGNLELKQQLQLALTNYPYCQVTADAHISLLGANQGQPTNVIAREERPRQSLYN